MAGVKALRQEEACPGRGTLKVGVFQPRAEQGQREGLVCVVMRAAGHDGARRDCGLVEIGDGEVHEGFSQEEFLFHS